MAVTMAGFVTRSAPRALPAEERDQLVSDILIALYREGGGRRAWTERLREIANQATGRRGGAHWEALEVLLSLQLRGYLEENGDYQRGGLTASGIEVARRLLER